jgi:putative addiction module component (TIGR02574 family)
MPMTKEQLLAEATALAPAERESLAEQLLITIDCDDLATVDAAWAAEVDRRLTAYDRGEIRSAPPDELFRRLREKHAR